MARRGSRFHVQRSIKRGTFWGRSPADAGSTALAGSTAILDSTGVPVVEGETIVRTRGMISVMSDQKANGENVVGAVGACIASDQAVAVGVGSLPTPYTDQDSDLWFLHQYFVAGITINSSSGYEGRPWTTYHFDSKAMRKFHTGQAVCFIVENGSGSGMEYILNFATLFKVA